MTGGIPVPCDLVGPLDREVGGFSSIPVVFVPVASGAQACRLTASPSQRFEAQYPIVSKMIKHVLIVFSDLMPNGI